jgi:hypothetical protein
MGEPASHGRVALLDRFRRNFSEDVSRTAKWLRRYWILIVSGAVLTCAVAVWLTRTPSDAAQFATYISGFATAITLIWLVAGFRIQADELSLQREELRLQRLAAEQQARELTNSAKLSSLGQIRGLLEDAEAAVLASPLGLKNTTEIQGAYFNKMEHWTDVEHDRDPKAVVESYQKWLPAELVARNYIRYVAAAMRIYIEYHHPGVKLDPKEEPECFVYVYQSWVFNAPFLSHHIGVAAMLAQFLWLMKPGLDRMRLAWLVASAKSLGQNMLKDGALEELRDKVLEHSTELAAICTPWPFEAKSPR